MNTPQETTIFLSTPDDYKVNWGRMSEEDKQAAFASGVTRLRYLFNVPLYGEGTSYKGDGTITPTIKHISQQDGYNTPNVFAYPPIPVRLLPAEVRAVMCWVLGEELPPEYINGLPRIKAMIDALGGLTLLEAADTPNEESGTEGVIEGNIPEDIIPS